MIHLEKKSGNFKKLACTSNPFIKGKIVSKEQFLEYFRSGEKQLCKRCMQKIKISLT